jgi:hypothetical protein
MSDEQTIWSKLYGAILALGYGGDDAAVMAREAEEAFMVREKRRGTKTVPLVPVEPQPTSVNACDAEVGPCACGAWHVKEQGPPKSLLKAAKELREAQRHYMNVRASGDVSPAIKEFAGAQVGLAADELDRAIEATEKRQLAPVSTIGQRVRDLGDPSYTPPSAA